MLENKNQTGNCYLNINYSSSKWDYILVTRKFIQNYLKMNFLNNEDISKVILTVTEMLENSFKYTIDGDIKIQLSKNIEENHLDFSTSNTSNKEDIIRAVNLITEMNDYADTLQYYIKKMRDRKKNKDYDGGLGLARINHEANARLSVTYDENSSTITVKARLKFAFI